MNILEFKEGFVLARTRTPSPDNWRLTYEIRYIFSLVSKLYDELISFDDPAAYLTAQQRGSQRSPDLHFYNMFDTENKWKKIPIKIREKLISIISDSSSFSNFEVIVKGSKIEDKTAKINKLKSLRKKGIPPIPEVVGSFDFWNSLTKEQKKHNALVDKGQDGLIEIIRQFPAYKGVKIIPDGRLKQLRWRVKENLILDDEKIKNPKFIKQKQGKGRKNKKVKEYVSVKTAFISARTTVSSRLKKLYMPIDNAVYYISIQDAYPPNTLRNEEPYWDQDLPPAKFRWDIKTEKFIGKIGNDDPIRLPDDKGANTFAEIYYSEMMPLFELLIDYMKNPDGTFKERFKIGYDKIVKKSFDDWISFSRIKAADEEAFTDLSLDFSNSVLNHNPDLFLHLLDPVRERYYQVIKQGLFPKKTGEFIENRVGWYLDLIKKGYGFADVMNDKTFIEYIDHYNNMITAYNIKKKDTMPMIEGFATKPKTKNKKQIAQWKIKVLEQRDKIGLGLLKAKGWHYTIPNEDFNPDIKFSEDKEIKTRRLDLENYLFELEAAIREREESKPKRTYKQELKYVVLRKYKLNKDIDTLLNYYNDIVINPDLYKKPDIYKEWIKKLLPTQVFEDEDIIIQKAKEEEEKIEAERLGEEKQIQEIIKKIKNISVFKKVVNRNDLKNLVKPIKI